MFNYGLTRLKREIYLYGLQKKPIPCMTLFFLNFILWPSNKMEVCLRAIEGSSKKNPYKEEAFFLEVAIEEIKVCLRAIEGSSKKNKAIQGRGIFLRPYK